MVGRCNQIAFLVAVAMGLASRSSRADPEASGSAQQLFARAVKMRDEGKCQVIPVGDARKCRESVAAFLSVYELNPNGLGALRNLAYIERSMGLVSSAARHFHELARKAPLDAKPERRQWAKFAEEEARALEPRAPHLVVKVPHDPPADLKVYLDEEVLSQSIWGAAVDVDPGAHAIRTESENVPTFAVSIELAERETRTIEVIFPVSTTVQPAVQVVDAVVVAPSAEAEQPVPSRIVTKVNLAPIFLASAGTVVLTAA